MSLHRTRTARKSWTIGEKTDVPAQTSEKKDKFDFEKMKTASTHEDPVIRKAAFIDYFERFQEFPSFLFDNEQATDPRLTVTIRDLSADESSSKALLDGIASLVRRLPSA